MADLRELIINTKGHLESQLGKHKLTNFIESCEEEFRVQVQHVAAHILNHQDINFVFVSGPTSSGKTTFTTQLSKYLTEQGKKSHMISLDDYYAIQPRVYDAYGRPDYESIETIDLDFLFEQLYALEQGEKIQLPTFDFILRERIFSEDKQIKLEKDDIILIEGLHGLAPSVFKNLEAERRLGIFIMPRAKLVGESRSLLESRDTRILRRISRDFLHRGADALSTIDYWPMIEKNEKIFIPQYAEEADFFINSALSYEYYVIPPKATAFMKSAKLLYQAGALKGSWFSKEGKTYAEIDKAFVEMDRLIKACESLPMIDTKFVPKTSILQEFI